MRYAALVDDHRGVCVFLRADPVAAAEIASMIGLSSPVWSSAGGGWRFPRGCTPDLVAAAEVLSISLTQRTNRVRTKRRSR